uniref:Protein kinase domain-containing protein n=1 Tax=Leersia perrieri TaxID=77586 RepID=A0A0D9XV35_9ORYZ
MAQLVGADVGGLISTIIQAVETSRQNKEECDQLARRVLMIAELLPPHLPEIQRPLVGLDDTLREAHEVVMSCQEKNVVYQSVMAGRQADKFRDVQSKIDSYISHVDVTTVPSSFERYHHLEYAEDVAQAYILLPKDKEDEEFSFAELVAATNNFAPDRMIGKGSSSTVYMGRLADGREVAIKQFYKDKFQSEHERILSHIRHNDIIRLLGCCLEERHEKKITCFPWFWRRQVVEPSSNPLLVFEYMKNGSLDKHLHGSSSSSSSPVITSWRMRIEILLGVSQAIHCLHTQLDRVVIHRDIRPSNILLDEAWVPHLSDFGFSVTGGNGNVDALRETGFGVVMLELLTGLRAKFRPDKKEGEYDGFLDGLVSFTLPIIEAGKLQKVLDRRPEPKPTPRQLEAFELVAQTAVCCLRWNGKDRPAILGVVAKLQAALDLIRADD